MVADAGVRNLRFGPPVKHEGRLWVCALLRDEGLANLDVTELSGRDFNRGRMVARGAYVPHLGIY